MGVETLLVDRREAARLLCCCPRTIDAMIGRGELPAVRLGRAVRVDLADLRRWIDDAKCETSCATLSQALALKQVET